MRQCDNLRKQKLKIYKNFSWFDLGILIIVIVVGFSIGMNISYNSTVKLATSIAIALIINIILLFYSSKNECRVYMLIFRMLNFIFSNKKYKKDSKNTTLDLVPYKCIDKKNGFLITKPMKGGITYKIAAIKFRGLNIWQNEPLDIENFYLRLSNILDITNLQISFVKIKEKENYSLNYKYWNECVQKNENVKINKKENYSKNTINLIDYYTSIFNDLEQRDKNKLVDSYYIVLTSNKDSELNDAMKSLSDNLNALNIDNNYVLGNELLKLNSKLLDIKINDELIKSYYDAKKNELKNKKDVEEKKTEEQKAKTKTILNIFKEKIKSLDIANSNNYKDEVKIDELLTNNEIEFKKNYFIKDKKYYNIQSLEKLPYDLNGAWAWNLFNNDANVVWTIRKITDTETENLINKKMRTVMDNLNNKKGIFGRSISESEVQAIEETNEQVTKEKRSLFDSCILIINKADSLNELKAKMKANKLECLSEKIKLNNLSFLQFEAYKQSFFKDLNTRFSTLQMLSNVISYGWCFDNDSINDENMLILGDSYNTNENIIFNQFCKKGKKRNNNNMFVLGTSGKGKSTVLSKMIVNNLASNNKVVVIDAQNEYQGLCENFDGQKIKLGINSDVSLNVLQIDTNYENFEFSDVLRKHYEWLTIFFSKTVTYFKQYPTTIYTFIQYLKDYYSSKFKSYEEIKALKNDRWFTIKDVIRDIENGYLINDKTQIGKQKRQLLNEINEELKATFTESGQYEKMFAEHTNIDLNKQLIVFDTTDLFNAVDDSYDFKEISIYILLKFIQNNIFSEENKEVNKLIVIDELHKYVSSENSQTLNFIFDLTKTVRKFNAGVLLATQNPSDFISGNNANKGRAILDNCCYALFLGLKENDLKAVDEMYKNSGGLNDTDKKFLANADVGTGILSIANNKTKIITYYNDWEKQQFFKQGDFN